MWVIAYLSHSKTPELNLANSVYLDFKQKRTPYLISRKNWKIKKEQKRVSRKKHITLSNYQMAMF